MKIGILAPFNPSFIKEYLNETNIPDINNAANAVNTLVLALLQAGHELKVFTMDMEGKRTKLLHGVNVDVYVLPSMLWPTRPNALDLKGTRSFRLGQLYHPGRLTRAIEPKIKSLDVLHAHWTYDYAVAAHEFSTQIPVFVTVRDWAPYIKSLQTKMRAKFDWWLRYKNFKKVMNDKNITFIANSKYTYDRIVNAYPDKTVQIIPNPIKNEFILNKKLNTSVCHQFISISQSIGDPRKNFTPMLQAFQLYRKDYPQAALHLVGAYSSTGKYYMDWQKEGLLEGVFFHGRLPHDEMMRLLDDMSYTIHPSVEETFGNILLEAMSRCVPCIGGDKSGAVPQVLGNGEYGLCCDIHSPQAILEQMRKLSNPDYAEILASKATEMLLTTYASDIIAEQHIKLFDKTIKIK